MKAIAWVVAGMALLGLKGYLESTAGTSTGTGDAASLNLPAIVAMLAASTCFYRALRNALASIIFRGSAKKPHGEAAAAPRRGPSQAFAVPPEDQFDADAAFERYMQQREDGLVDLPAPPPTPAPRASFGRRVL